MDAPKIIKAIKHNGETFSKGDIVDFVLDCGFADEEHCGRIVTIEGEIIEFDCSLPYNAYTRKIGITSLKSISHAAEQEEYRVYNP